jgi:hypothetical protein
MRWQMGPQGRGTKEETGNWNRYPVSTTWLQNISYPAQKQLTRWCAHTLAASSQLNCHQQQVSNGLVLDSPGCDRRKHTSERGSHISVTDNTGSIKIQAPGPIFLESRWLCWHFHQQDNVVAECARKWLHRSTTVQLQGSLQGTYSELTYPFNGPCVCACVRACVCVCVCVSLYLQYTNNRQYGIFLRHRTDR